MTAPNKTGKTTDVASIVNSAVMAVEKEMRKNNVPFALFHDELRAVMTPIIACAVADHKAEVAREAMEALVEAATEAAA